MVDPLEYLIGFYSVVGRRLVQKEGSQSLISQGIPSSSTIRSPGVTSVVCVRSSERGSNASQQTKKNVTKRVTNSH